jgi:tetratricopeptide (TPR) repeat protein/HAMP domain-containing protein
MVGVVPLVLAAAGLVVLVFLGVLDRMWHAWSVIDLIALGAACALAAACWRERRVYRILPFRNLIPAGAPAHDEVERIVSGFTVQLGLEIQRIMRLLEEDPLGEPTDVVSAEPKRGVTVQPTKSRVAFKTPITESGTRGDLPTAEVGTIEVGPLKLPIGVLLNLAARLVRRALRGAILESANGVTVVAVCSGRRGKKWTVHGAPRTGCPLHAVGTELACELAHRIVWDTHGSSVGDADARSFRHLVNGLEHYDHFLREGKLEDLDRAERSFARAVILSPRFAAGYHNLGVVQSQRVRISSDLDLPVAETASHTETNMWLKAVQLDPTLAVARLQLAIHTLEDQNPADEAVEWARSAVELPLPPGSLKAVAHYWLGISLREQGAGSGDGGKIIDALEQLRTAELELLDVRARQLVSGVDESGLDPVLERLSRVLMDQSACQQELANQQKLAKTASSGRRRSAHERYKREAERLLDRAQSWSPRLADIFVQRGNLQVSLERPDSACEAFLAALRLNPLNAEAIGAVGQIFASADDPAGDTYEAAAVVFRISLSLDPTNAEPWMMLAHYARYQHKLTEALALAGMALVLNPLDPGTYDVLADLCQQSAAADSATGPSVIEPIYRKLADLARGGHAAEPAASHEETTHTDDEPVYVERWARAWIRASHAREKNMDAPELSRALAEIEDILARSSSRPEFMLVEHEVGRLHYLLATIPSASRDDRQHHLSATVDFYERATKRQLPVVLSIPVGWIIELGDALCDAGREDDDYGRAVQSYTAALGLQPPSLNFITSGHHRITALRGDDLDLPYHARALAGRAQAWAALGNDAAAAQDCYAALRLAPRYGLALYILANVFARRREYDRALGALRRTMEVAPVSWAVEYHAEAANFYGMQADEAAKPDERDRLQWLAVTELRAALRRAPEPGRDAEIRATLAVHLNGLKQTEDALAEQRVAAQLGKGLPGNSGRHLDLAGMLADHGDFSEAESEFISAKAASEHELAGATDEARRSVMAVRAQAGNGLAWFYAERLTKLDDARRLAADAVGAALQSSDPQLIANCIDTRGWIAYRSGHADQAVADFSQALQPLGNAERWGHLALALEMRYLLRHEQEDRRRDINRAADIWQHIIDNFPDAVWSERSHQHLARLQRQPHVPARLIESDEPVKPTDGALRRRPSVPARQGEADIALAE